MDALEAQNNTLARNIEDLNGIRENLGRQQNVNNQFSRAPQNERRPEMNENNSFASAELNPQNRNQRQQPATVTASSTASTTTTHEPVTMYTNV